MENKQIAVEWLEEIYLTIGIDRNVHFHQAKAMEKEQIEDAYGYEVYDEDGNPLSAEQYYNETYGGQDES
jgi:hypothetical protein